MTFLHCSRDGKCEFQNIACILCDETGHIISGCRTFLSMSVSDKKKCAHKKRMMIQKMMFNHAKNVSVKYFTILGHAS